MLADFDDVALPVPVEACCELDDEPDDEADDELDEELDEEPFAELLLPVLLLDALWFFVDGSGGGGASCTLDEDPADDEEAD